MDTKSQRNASLRTYDCPLEAALDLIAGKWKTILLHHLFDGTMRFGELKKKTPRITQRMLTKQLRELEADGLIAREVYREVPPKVEYTLTELGSTLGPVLQVLAQWGAEHSPRFAGSGKRETGSGPSAPKSKSI